ncbi:MAG: hypothetical protein CMJ29_13320 [Phycisphaerae bacterium]|nr:hypothetical protein [Phycisphaerae bacterium]|tara:strand:- start:470 stop:1195 length:726 start_codon:yes stop_codon:yes gene_type:complete
MSTAHTDQDRPRLYAGDGDRLLEADRNTDRIVLLPSSDPKQATIGGGEIRIQWGQSLLRDVLAGRYRTVVCGINDTDNSHGIIGTLLEMVTTSQWTIESATSYAKVFQDAIGLHDRHDNEPYVLKFDLDSLLIIAILRPKNKDFFTPTDLERGFRTVSKMLEKRRDRQAVASVSFLGAHSNKLRNEDGSEPPFETVLKSMYNAGYRGDVYPSLAMWHSAPTGVFATYPFPESLDRMRDGSS